MGAKLVVALDYINVNTDEENETETRRECQHLVKRGSGAVQLVAKIENPQQRLTLPTSQDDGSWSKAVVSENIPFMSVTLDVSQLPMLTSNHVRLASEADTLLSSSSIACRVSSVHIFPTRHLHDSPGLRAA